MSTATILREKTGDSHGRNDDGARGKTRVGQACARCRSRKDRCDGLRPSCSACRNADQPCSYEPPTKKRGLPEGYVRSLEKLLGMFIDKIDGFEDVAAQMLQSHGNVLRKAWNNTSLGDELHLTWKDSRLLQELETLLSQPTTNADQTSTGGKRKRDEEDSTDTEETEVNISLTAEYAISRLGVDSTASQLSLNAFKRPSLPSSARQLLDHYFVHTHCYFPVVTRPLLLKTFYDCSNNPQYVEQDKGALALLWAILAYTSRQTAPLNMLSARAGSSQLSPQVIRATARRLLFEDVESHTILHAKALLIHTLLDVGLNDWSSAWKSVGHATRIVLDLGHTPVISKQSLSVTLQGCFILDTVISIHRNLRPHLRREDVEAFGFVNEDGHEEWEPWTGFPPGGGESSEPSFSISCFNRLTEVFLVLSDAMYPLLLQPVAGWSEAMRTSTKNLSHLRNSSLFQREPNDRTPPHHVYLQLSYFFSRALLLKFGTERGETVGDRAQVAYQILRLSEICRVTPAIGIENMPPLFSDCLRMASELASSEPACFEPQCGLPPYQEITSTTTILTSHLGKIWPSFTGIEDRMDGQIPHQRALPNTDWDGHSVDSLSNDRPTTADLSQSRPSLSQPWQLAQSTAVRDVNDLTAWPLPGNHAGPSMISTPQHHNPPFSHYNDVSGHFGTANNNARSVDASTLGLGSTIEPIFSADVPITGTSPGFQGDKIDAIFHEMAYLDTNEWNLERAIGLKDFGFSDDMTFQAFCNDPERLIIPPPSTTHVQQPTQQSARNLSNSVNAMSSHARGVSSGGTAIGFQADPNSTVVGGGAWT